jgi:hypothetical protein
MRKRAPKKRTREPKKRTRGGPFRKDRIALREDPPKL